MIKGDRSIGEALKRFENGERGGMSKRAYRDMIIALYINAIDARYHDFRTQVSSEARESALGLDLAVLGLTSGAAIAKESIVNELSAAASAFAGARAAVDKNLYFDKTLPALLASMDAERTKVRTRLVEKGRLSAQEYPLAAAFADLSAYEMAGSLDRAIGKITSEAAADQQEANEEYDKAIKRSETACLSKDNLRSDLVEINTTVYELLGSSETEQLKKASLKAAFEAFDRGDDYDESKELNEQASDLLDGFDTPKFCTVAALQAAREKLQETVAAAKVAAEAAAAAEDTDGAVDGDGAGAPDAGTQTEEAQVAGAEQ